MNAIAAALESTMEVGPWDVPRHVYHACRECLSHGALTDYRKSVPLFRGRWIDGTIPPDAPTEPLMLGTALHLLALQEERFAEEFVVANGELIGDRRTKAGKEAWADLCECAGRRGILTQEQATLCADMAAAIRAHPIAGPLLERPGRVELPIRWRDPQSGLWVRNLFDKVIPDLGVILDLKTTVDPSPAAFARSVANFHYAEQAALYQRGALEALGLEADFLFVAVGKEPPHEVAVYLLDDDALAWARRRNEQALAEIADRRRRGDWSGRQAERIETLSLPSWSMKE